MTRIIILITSLILSGPLCGNASPPDSTEVFLLTCLPGKTIVTVYGHSAIRMVKKSEGFDKVYSWGVYDFSTPHFAWKFAQGRLNYLLEEVSYENFMQQYLFEKRTVVSQKIRMSNAEAETLMQYIHVNLRPENVLYLYDFYYDNCATRIRDILEKSMEGRIIYPVTEYSKLPSFRKLLNQSEQPMPWLIFGTDLLIGKAGDKKADFREQMYLPEYLKNNLSQACIKNSGESAPLLEKAEIVLDFQQLESAPKYTMIPIILSCLLLVIFLILSVFHFPQKLVNVLDGIFILTLSLTSILLVFTSFFTDHQVMKMNYNLIWLNPFLLIAFITLLIRKAEKFWFRIICISSAGFLLAAAFIPQSINLAMYPLIVILILRSGMRGWYLSSKRDMR